MIFNDFLQSRGIDPATVLLMRHTPSEPTLRQALRKLAMTRHDLFNAYQQVQRPLHRAQLRNARFVASLIGVEPGIAEFVGLYKRGALLTINPQEYWDIEENRELRNYGLKGPSENDRTHVWVALDPIVQFAPWTGMVLEFPKTRCQYRSAAKWPLQIISSPRPLNEAA